MGGKKKAKKASKDNDEEDDSTNKLRIYYKRKCTELQVHQSSKMIEKFNLFEEEGILLKEVGDSLE